METVIRPLQAENYKSAKDIFYDAFDKYNLPVKDFGLSWRLRSPKDSYGIFSKEGDLLGLAIVSFHKRNGTNRYLDYLAVHSTFRGQDIGTRLLTFILDGCRRENTAIHLYPVKSDRIRAWYKTFGFEETAGGYLNLHWYSTRGQSAPYYPLIK